MPKARKSNRSFFKVKQLERIQRSSEQAISYYLVSISDKKIVWSVKNMKTVKGVGKLSNYIINFVPRGLYDSTIGCCNCSDSKYRGKSVCKHLCFCLLKSGLDENFIEKLRIEGPLIKNFDTVKNAVNIIRAASSTNENWESEF